MEKIIFVDPETNEEITFAVEEQTMLNGNTYLLVSEGDDDECDAYILKELRDEDGETTYEMVEDDVEFNALAKVFAELVDEDTELEY